MTPSAQSKVMNIFAFGVAFIGLGVLIYGGYTIKFRITSPFAGRTPSELNFDQFNQLAFQTEQQQLENLKNADSDKDTLSDYDEINIYNTSPYIEDTDSDGVSDAEEIRLGTDPNCLPGENCLGIRIVTPNTKISDLFPQFSDSETTLKDKTLEEFRGILIEQGFDQESLDAIDDETLLVILEETLKLQDENANVIGDPTVDDAELDYDQMRLLLIDLGVSEDEVYSLSNNEVAEIIQSLQ